MAKSGEKWRKVARCAICGKSCEKLEKWEIVVKSWEGWGKVGKTGGKVPKSGEKWRKVAKSE